jgi:hypothetical protein
MRCDENKTKQKQQPFLRDLKNCPAETQYCVKSAINLWNSKAESLRSERIFSLPVASSNWLPPSDRA